MYKTMAEIETARKALMGAVNALNYRMDIAKGILADHEANDRVEAIIYHKGFINGLEIAFKTLEEQEGFLMLAQEELELRA